jgi:hypothetical protein
MKNLIQSIMVSGIAIMGLNIIIKLLDLSHITSACLGFILGHICLLVNGYLIGLHKKQ